jgi:hypothetical protein
MLSDMVCKTRVSVFFSVGSCYLSFKVARYCFGSGAPGSGSSTSKKMPEFYLPMRMLQNLLGIYKLYLIFMERIKNEIWKIKKKRNIKVNSYVLNTVTANLGSLSGSGFRSALK